MDDYYLWNKGRNKEKKKERKKKTKKKKKKPSLDSLSCVQRWVRGGEGWYKELPSTSKTIFQIFEWLKKERRRERETGKE